MHLFDNRMLPSTFEFILDEIGEKLIRTTDGNEMVPADKQLLLSLWRFATTDSYRQVLQLFRLLQIKLNLNIIIY